MRIGIDLMGSETAPDQLFEGVILAARQRQGVTFLVIASEAVVEKWVSHPKVLALSKESNSRIVFQIASEIIEMGDDPLSSIRQKKQSSMMIGLKLLKKKFIDAFISCGNTGALITGAALSLPLLPEMKRPALLATLPTQKGYVAVVDVGGNVSCKAHHLVQFAAMGAAYQRCSQNIAVPKVGLLNIGVESKKGTTELREAYRILTEQSDNAIEFIGNVEGREVFKGKVDVLVTDGFTGNVLLKTSEGVSFFILDYLKGALKHLSDQEKLTIVNQLKMEFDPEEYAGAIVAGIDRVLVKCHGKSTSKGLCNGILGAIDLVQNGFIEQIKKHLQ